MIIRGFTYLLVEARWKSLGPESSQPDLLDYERLLKTLLRYKRHEELVNACNVTSKAYPKATLPVELLAMVYVDGGDKSSLVDFSVVLEHVELHRPDILVGSSPWVSLARGCYYFQSGKDLTLARNYLEVGLQKQPNMKALLVYANLLLALKEHSSAFHILTRE